MQVCALGGVLQSMKEVLSAHAMRRQPGHDSRRDHGKSGATDQRIARERAIDQHDDGRAHSIKAAGLHRLVVLRGGVQTSL